MEEIKLCITILLTATCLTCLPTGGLKKPAYAQHSENEPPSHHQSPPYYCFFALISYGLTGSIAVKSTIGTILAIISLGATIVFLYLLPKLYQQPTEEDQL
jgi:hypothetical protein